MKTALAIFFGSLLAYVSYVIFSSWKNQTGTVWQRILGTANESATILWAKFVAAIAIIVGGMDYIADMVGSPEVKEAIQGVINPKYVAGFLLAVALITVIARKRTM